MKLRLIALVSACCFAVAACGSGSDGGSDGEADAAQASATTAQASTSQPPETTAPEETTTTVEEATTSEVPPEPMAVREPLELAPVSAGPLSVTPSECTVEGADLEGPGGAESMAFAGDWLFVANDSGVLAFTISGGADCVLTLDTSVGNAGVMTDDDHLSSLSGTPDGRLVASGVLGSMVFDVAEGLSYECGMTGYVTLSPDGTTALMNFPGREAIEVWTLSDTNCTESTTLTFDGIPEVRYVTYDGTDLLVGGHNAEEFIVVARYRDGVPVWTEGSDETGADNWWGWVHGMAPCGSYTCMIDTNTDSFSLIGADGAVAANFNFSDLVGRRAWIEPVLNGPDGASYVLFDDAVDDENDVRTYFASVVRLEVAG